MNKSDLFPVTIIAFSFITTQFLAYAVSADNNFTLNYIALWTFGLQWTSFILADGFLFGNKRTEMYFDLMGSVGFVTATIINLVIEKHFRTRVLLLNLLVILWTVRLGTFLHSRIKRNNGIDLRFQDYKKTSWLFLMIWTLQSLWVFVMLLPLLIAPQMEVNYNLKTLDYIGVILYTCGLACESIADNQKQQFRSEPKNKQKFIKSGLWKYSRHPNYFGEILLWIGVALVAFSGTQSCWVFVTPVFIASVLIFGSGIPILEKISDASFGKNSEYKLYKETTPVLIPFIDCAGDALF